MYQLIGCMQLKDKGVCYPDDGSSKSIVVLIGLSGGKITGTVAKGERFEDGS